MKLQMQSAGMTKLTAYRSKIADAAKEPWYSHVKSYGIDMATGYLVDNAQPVGGSLPQSVGEPGTQLTLQPFHAGGLAG